MPAVGIWSARAAAAYLQSGYLRSRDCAAMPIETFPGRHTRPHNERTVDLYRYIDWTQCCGEVAGRGLTESRSSRLLQTGTGSISPAARWHVTREISWIGSVTPRPGKSAGVDFSYKKCKGSPYSITERRVPELITVLGSQPVGDVSHKPGGGLPLLSARPAVTPATLKEAATNFAAWWTEAQWVWTVCLRLLPDSVATAIWTRALLRLSPAR